MAERRSDDHYVDLPEGITTDQMMGLVERAADNARLSDEVRLLGE